MNLRLSLTLLSVAVFFVGVGYSAIDYYLLSDKLDKYFDAYSYLQITAFLSISILTVPLGLSLNASEGQQRTFPRATTVVALGCVMLFATIVMICYILPK